jgi:hypothetical protein
MKRTQPHGPDDLAGLAPERSRSRAAASAKLLGPAEPSAAAAAAPIALIDLGEPGAQGEPSRMRLTDEARALLQDCGSARPIAVVCVVGRSRTGKSFLLNRGLLGSSAGRAFQVSASTRACTKGLWLAGPPVPAAQFWANLGMGPPPPGHAEDYDVLVVDTEGINALDRDQSYDMRIFTLALLLSSVFVYNSLGAIDENAIATLSAVADVAETLKRQNAGRASGIRRPLHASQGHSAAGSSSSLELPGLLWVVRDFALDIEEEGETQVAGDPAGDAPEGGASRSGPPLQDDDYLEQALRADQLDPRSSKAALRHVLTQAFPRRCCQTMVRPADREDDMKRLQDLPDDALRPQFVGQLRSLRAKLRGLCVPKRVAGRQVDASLLADLVAAYVEAINSDRVPAVVDTWTQVARARCAKAVDQAVEYVERVCGIAAAEGNPAVAAAAAAASPTHEEVRPFPGHLHAHITHGLRRAERIYRDRVANMPDTSEFDRQLQQRLLVAVASGCSAARQSQEQAAVRLAAAAAQRWAEAVRAGESADPGAFLSGALQAARAAVAEEFGTTALAERLPASGYSVEIIPSVVEREPRLAAAEAAAERLAWTVAARLAACPDLLAAHGIALPETGVSAEELRAALDRAEEQAQRAAGAEAQLAEERARGVAAERRAAEAQAEADLAAQRAAAAEAATQAAQAILSEDQVAASRLALAAAEAEAEARAEARLNETIASYERDLDERQAELEAARAQAAALQTRLTDATRRLEAATHRVGALEAEVQRLSDALAARAAEMQRLTAEHGAERMEWATRLRTSETEAARAVGQAEALQVRVNAYATLQDQLDEMRKAVHAAEVARSRAEAECRAAEAAQGRAEERLNAREAELRDGLRTLKEATRSIKTRAS